METPDAPNDYNGTENNADSPGRPPPDRDDESGAETLVGILERITFANEENGFLIGRLDCTDSKETVTIKGTVPGIREGETVKVWGSWEEHPTYGPQFAVRSFVIMEPTTLEGMERYLINNIKGIGPKLASRIVKTFGNETFDVIDSTPEKLLEVPKFQAKVLAEIQISWAEHRARRNDLMFLHSIGLSQLFAERIYAHYGIGAVEAVKENPFRLAMDIQGIGFRSADNIARNMGFAQDAPQRVEAGLLHALDEASAEGHTGLPRLLLLQRAVELLEVPMPLTEEALARLLADGLLKPLAVPAGLSTWDEASEDTDVEMVFRGRFHHAEEDIARHLQRIAASDVFTRFKNLSRIVTALEKESGLYLAEEQRQAVEAALAHKLLVITGGPGTGKTTIIRFILGLVTGAASEHISQISLAAPTGKAAKRMGEATGRPASTIHRLLEAGPKGFQRNADRQIEAELVIIDESSMIDTRLMASMLEAIPDHARLVLVGDVDQLPSVGAGRVLGDLIESGIMPVTRLETIFRQSTESRITENAHAIRKGQKPDLARPEGEELLDFYFMPDSDPQRIVEKIRMMVTERIPERFNFDSLADIQVITPMHRGLTGAQNLNKKLQEWLNPKGEEIVFGDKTYRVGDKVMQTRNDYEREVFNGDMGIITGFDPDSGQVFIDFEGGQAIYERKALENLTLGYAITVHKSQGSEYPAVLLPLTTHHSIMLQRNLLYTAITRGKSLVVLIGTEKAVGMAVRNARPVIRHTGLLARLAEYREKEGREDKKNEEAQESMEGMEDGVDQEGEVDEKGGVDTEQGNLKID